MPFILCGFKFHSFLSTLSCNQKLKYHPAKLIHRMTQLLEVMTVMMIADNDLILVIARVIDKKALIFLTVVFVHLLVSCE